MQWMHSLRGIPNLCIMHIYICINTILSVVVIITTYRIAGNFGEVFNLANLRFYGKSPNLKSAIFYSDVI